MADHSHAHPHGLQPAAPRALSLLRLSLAERLAGVGVMLGLLWLGVIATIS